MKKKILRLFMMCICMALIFGASAAAETDKYGNLFYDINDGFVRITDCEEDATEVVIPREINGIKVTQIYDWAFYNKEKLAQIEIPDTIESIGANAFSGTAYHMNPANWENECLYVGNWVVDSAVYSRNSLKAGTVGIACGAFSSNLVLKSITLPEGIKYVNSNAFSSCTELSQINLPDSVISITDMSFYGTSYYNNEENWEDGVLYLGKCLIGSNPYVENVKIKEGTKCIADNAFQSRSSLKNVEFPSSVTHIGRNAFGLCTSLTSIKLNEGLENIAPLAFHYCIGAEDVHLPSTLKFSGYGAFSDFAGTKVNISNIENYLNCEYVDAASNPLAYSPECELYLKNEEITSVTIPNTVKKIPIGAFRHCDKITSITIPESVTSIGNKAFENCFNLSEVDIKNGTKAIGSYAFAYCEKLKKVNIPESVTTVEERAFQQCSALEDINLPNSITSIEKNAFYGCNGLKSIALPNKLEKISNETFGECTSLQSVVIPKSVKTIGNAAFLNCLQLKNILFEGSEAEWNAISGFEYQNECLIYAENKYYNAVKKTYNFVTNTEEKLDSITGYIVDKAPEIKNKDMLFLGWYDNEEFSGSPVTFPHTGAETLYARWAARDGSGMDTAFLAKENSECTAVFENGGKLYYEFTPKKNGEYIFYIMGMDRANCTLYDSFGNPCVFANQDQVYDLKITVYLTEGSKYYLEVESPGAGNITVGFKTNICTRTECITSEDGYKIFRIEPVTLEENMVVVLALYKNGALVQMKKSLCKNDYMYFVADKSYDEARVMVWESLNSMIPVTKVEVLH